jgi:pSer/pThr/pTyr-binding forkhead associated (FHA) protein
LLKAKKTKNFDMEANIVSLGKLSKRLKERTYTINSTEKEFVLGRNREAQCVILDVNVSRRHASIKYSSISGWLITDNKVYSWLYL